MRPALRERLRTHKVFTKRTALYLNYPKLSYHVFRSLASHNLMISLENRQFKESSSSSPIAFHSSSNLKMLYLKVDYMSPFNAMCVLCRGVAVTDVGKNLWPNPLLYVSNKNV